jgi:hypothetical protein
LGGGALLLIAACGSSELDERVVEQTLAVTAPTQVGEFALLASGRATFRDRANIAGGHIGAASGTGDAVTAGFDARMALGKATLGQRVVLRDRAAAGDLFANSVVRGSLATYTSLSPYAAPPAAPPISAFTGGTGSLAINVPTTLAAGNYGNVTVNSTLTLSGGTYQLQSLTLGPNAIVQAAQPTTLRVAGKITGSNNTRLVPTGTQGASALRIVVAGATDATGGIVLGNDARLTALVLSRASVNVGDRLIGSGAIAARDITLGFDARFTFATGFECNADAACSDGNACTADACVDAKCTHTAVANGSACPDDGNDCTADLCTSGLCGHPASPAGTTCSAGTCDGAGVCVPPECVADSDCDDEDPCSSDSCQGGNCENVPAPVGTPCAHGNICDGAGICVQCVGDADCDDELACTTDSCQANLCTYGNAPAGTPCGHTGESCDGAGVCVPPECVADSDCDDEDPCSLESCQSGSCEYVPAPVGTPCAHGNICDGAGICVQCVSAAECDDELACTTDACQASVCTHENAPAGTPCGDSGESCDGAGDCQ